MKIIHSTKPVPRLVLAVILASVLAGASIVDLSAHRVIGRRNPLLSALVQSPSASPVDLPVPIFNTGLSVICFRVTNTSATDARITAVGLELPGRLSGFSLISPLDHGLTINENVEPIPGFGDVSLDVAVVTGPNFSGGQSRLGLPPNAPPLTICLAGPFDARLPIETLLNGVFVGFRGGDASANAFDIGVWERR